MTPGSRISEAAKTGHHCHTQWKQRAPRPVPPSAVVLAASPTIPANPSFETRVHQLHTRGLWRAMHPWFALKLVQLAAWHYKDKNPTPLRGEPPD